MNTQRGIASFLVRFAQERWRDDHGEPHVQWRGHIRHVQGNDEASFSDAAEAIAFMQQHLTKLTLDALPRGSPMEQEKLVRESFKLWEQFASTYNKLMLETMARTLEQSDTFKKQMDKVLDRSMQMWSAPASPDLSIVEKLNQIQKQIEALSQRVEHLERTKRANSRPPRHRPTKK